MLVAGKLRNQEKLLRYFARNRNTERQVRLVTAAKTLRALRAKALLYPGESSEQVRAGLMGLEGTGGRVYWDQWTDLLPEKLSFDALNEPMIAPT